MKQVFNRIVATGTFISFGFFITVPAVATEQAFSKMLETKVGQYNSAPRNKGTAAFLKAYLPELSDIERGQILKMYSGSTYPTMKYLGHDTIEVLNGSQKVTVEFLNDFSQNQAKINGKIYTYDNRASLQKNVDALQKVLGAKNISLSNWLVPEVHAAGNLFLPIGLVLIGLFGAYALYKGGISTAWDSLTGANKDGAQPGHTSGTGK